jgi:hypothetical protein
MGFLCSTEQKMELFNLITSVMEKWEQSKWKLGWVEKLGWAQKVEVMSHPNFVVSHVILAN